MMKKTRYFIVAFLLLILPLTSCGTKEATGPSDVNSPEVSGYTGLSLYYTETTLETGSIEETVERVYDSVVAIEAYLNGTHYGSGSGVLIGHTDDLSFIVTCHHVIENCTTFQAVLSDGSKLAADLVGGDPDSDIALLAVHQTGLCYATWFKDTDLLKLGSTVICIGNPLGTLPGSVSTGVVSYNNRLISVDEYHSMNLIQTDVAINSGNSGGALFNGAGALIGIVNAKYSSSGIEGLGFAIPAKEAMKIVDSILSTASYDSNTNTWATGYVEGRWALEFELGYGGRGFVRTTIGIASAATSKTASDYGKLQANDLLNSITIRYKDTTKLEKSLTNITANTTIEAVYHFIYDSNLSLGDTLIFEITRNNVNVKVEIPLVQYQYGF